MSKKALIICCGGMSSSMIARKAMQILKEKNLDVYVEACDVSNANRMLKNKSFDLYLISPQIKMVTNTISAMAHELGVKVVDIPKEDYVPVGKGIHNLTDLIESNLDLKE